MEIATSRFGPMEIEAEDVIHFPAGLVGLEESRRWIFLADRLNDAVAWLQDVDRPDVALAVVSPRRFVPGYRMRVARQELAPLELDDPRSATILVIAGKRGHALTLNLKAPLVIHLHRRLGRQVVANGDLPVQHVLGSDHPAWRRSA